MKIRITTDNMSPVRRRGDVVDLPPSEAVPLFQAGYAVPEVEDEIETAVPAPPAEVRDPLDHDGDGRKGGARRKAADPVTPDDQ